MLIGRFIPSHMTNSDLPYAWRKEVYTTILLLIFYIIYSLFVYKKILV